MTRNFAREYCGALPSWSDTASCLKAPNHTGPHRTMEGREWPLVDHDATCCRIERMEGHTT